MLEHHVEEVCHMLKMNNNDYYEQPNFELCFHMDMNDAPLPAQIFHQVVDFELACSSTS